MSSGYLLVFFFFLFSLGSCASLFSLLCSFSPCSSLVLSFSLTNFFPTKKGKEVLASFFLFLSRFPEKKRGTSWPNRISFFSHLSRERARNELTTLRRTFEESSFDRRQRSSTTGRRRPRLFVLFAGPPLPRLLLSRLLYAPYAFAC